MTAFSCTRAYKHIAGEGRRIGRVRMRHESGVRSFLLPLAVLVHLFAFASESLVVGGISNSKVVVPSAETVPYKHIELEPFFSLEYFNDGHHSVRFGGGLRVTPGLLDNLEAGVNVNYLNVEDSELIQTKTNFGDIEAGVKFRFLDEEKGRPFSLAYQGGVTFPLSDGATWVVEPGGLILTKNFTDEFSMEPISYSESSSTAPGAS